MVGPLLGHHVQQHFNPERLTKKGEKNKLLPYVVIKLIWNKSFLYLFFSASHYK